MEEKSGVKTSDELIAGIGEIVDICIFHYDLGFHFPSAIVLVDVVVRSAARSA